MTPTGSEIGKQDLSSTRDCRDKTKPNLKRHHHKVRTGCDTCKRRKVKCDEASPSCFRCLKAGFRCQGYTSVPRTFHFVQQSQLDDRSVKSRHEPQSEGESASPATSEEDIELSNRTHPQQPAMRNSLVDLRRTPMSPFHDEEEIRAHNLALHWITHYTCSRVLPEFARSTYWTNTIPQIAWEYDCLRYSMIAFGLLGASFHRKDSASKYEAETVRALQYSNRAIRSLSRGKSGLPNTVFALCAVMFWQLELVRGNLLASASHISAAHQIAAESDRKSTEAQITAVITQQLAEGPRNELKFSAKVPQTTYKDQSPDERKRRAVEVLLRSLPKVIAAIERARRYYLVRTHCAQAIQTLERIRQELVWTIARWGNNCSLTIQSTQESTTPLSAIIKFPPGQRLETLFEEALAYLDGYLVNNAQFSISDWQRSLLQELPSFLLVTASSDLEMRQDLTEYMEVSRLLQEAQDAAVVVEISPDAV